MNERDRNTQEIERDGGLRADHEVAETELGSVADPDAEQPGESRIDRSAKKADPTV